MLLVGGAAYDGVKWVELTEGNIAVYDTQTGAVTAADPSRQAARLPLS